MQLLTIGVIAAPAPAGVRVPGHPVTTMVFVLACWAISASTIVQYPENAGIGVVILLVGVAVYWLWVRQASPHKEV